MPSKTAAEDFFKGLWLENPVFRQMLGMCPILAVTNTVVNGLAMGLATSFVLVSSSFLISLIKKLIPSQVRIASYIVVIATFVTIADRLLAAYFWDISKALGPFVPLIVVNCIILGRAEAFASKNTVGRSVLDALGMSAGFILALFVLSSIREILGSGAFLGFRILGPWFEPWIIMVLPAGAFITLGIMMAISIQVERKRKRG